ncbi:phage tail family protein [Clostridium botulinum D/C]|uniref:phage tail family protein n=1 Tax=Clostridium botulinum TaxID=1491 RepID=UPI001E2910B7|nr:phage tail family protein [Clostridium botulinum D/C]MCD3360215.1 phage tail family protein [Clostridium botulinum D/C]MCD3361682.1 phage tail family protein [Clostridium botulinum D/C]MCD3366020.1 phage tail family protein [Clostridium botulinum D/C]
MRKLKIINNSKEIILSNAKPFILETIDNTSSNNANIYSSNSAGVDGISIDDVTLQEKLLPINAGIVALNKEDLDRKRAYLSSFFNPKDSFELIYTNNTTTRKIKGRVQSIVFQEPVSTIQKFLIQMLCPNPYWQDLKEIRTNIAMWEGDFQFPLEIPQEGIEMGHRVSNLICNIYNAGDVKCGIRIQFKALASVQNPSFFNINTRQFIKVNQTLKAGDVLEITTDFSNKRIELIQDNGVRKNVLHWLDLDSDFLQLNVGDNLFRYDAEKGIDNLEVAIYHTPLYLGV